MTAKLRTVLVHVLPHTTRGRSRRSARQNREEKELLVRAGKSHGVLVYDDDTEQPVGWCQFGPREELPRIERKRGYKDTGEDSLWRVTCFFIDKDHRKRGVAREALRATLEVMERRGAKTVEAYPLETTRERYSSSFLWAGTKHSLLSIRFQADSEAREERRDVEENPPTLTSRTRRRFSHLFFR